MPSRFSLIEVVYPACEARPYTGRPCDADAVYSVRLRRLPSDTLETVPACAACVADLQAIDADRVANLASIPASVYVAGRRHPGIAPCAADPWTGDRCTNMADRYGATPDGPVPACADCARILAAAYGGAP